MFFYTEKVRDGAPETSGWEKRKVTKTGGAIIREQKETSDHAYYWEQRGIEG